MSKDKYPSIYIFEPTGGYCVSYPSNLFRNARSFENWGIFSDIPQFKLGNIRPRDEFKPSGKNDYHFDPCDDA